MIDRPIELALLDEIPTRSSALNALSGKMHSRAITQAEAEDFKVKLYTKRDVIRERRIGGSGQEGLRRRRGYDSSI